MSIDVPDEDLDLLKRIRTDLLYQPFLEKLNTLLNNCAARGYYYVATSGLRTWEEQDKLYAQGRTAPGMKVTNARGGYSLHNFAIAVDFCKHAGAKWEGKLQPDYRPSEYKVLAEEAEKLGLEAGLYWKSIQDPPHIQLPYNKLHGITLADLRKEYNKGKYAAVFAYLDQFSW